MPRAKELDARLELLLAGDPATGDSLDRDLSALISEINELVPEPVIPPGIAEAHIAKIVETAGSLGPQPVSQPAKTARLGWRTQLSSLSATPARKVAAATLSLTATFSGLAYAGVLPDPIQRTAADIARLAGITLPDPGVITDDSDGPDVTDDPGSESLTPNPEKKIKTPDPDSNKTPDPDSNETPDREKKIKTPDREKKIKTPDPDRNNNGEPVDGADAVDKGEQGSDDGGPSVGGEHEEGRENDPGARV